MSKLLAWIAASFLMVSPVFAKKNKDWKDSFQSHGIDLKDLSILVEGEDAKPLIAWREDKLMVPASLTKLVSVAASLKKLGLSYKWTSSLRAKGQILGESLRGDLCFYGGGNPSFITEKLEVLVENFKRSGVNKVSGDLLVDESFFDSDYYDQGRQQNRVIRAYDSPVSGASFNWNAVNIYIRPGVSVGKLAKVFVQPMNSYVEIENKLITHGKSTHVEIHRKMHKGVEKFVISGRFAIGEEEKTYYRSIENAALWTGHNLLEKLKREGIHVQGKVKLATCPKASLSLAEVESKDLGLVIRDTMKFSNNFLTEILVKTMGREKSGNPGSMEEGLKEIQSFLKDNSMDKEDFQILSVSGFSQENQIRTKALVRLLEIMEKDFAIYPEYLSSLPIAQIDGTMKNRMSESNVGKIRAKTGLLNSVVGLAGYGTTRKNQRFRFALIYNGKSAEEWKVRKASDQFLEGIIGDLK